MRLFAEPDWDDYEVSEIACRCGETMLVNRGMIVDVVRCRNCGREGPRGPEHKLMTAVRRRLDR